jgi:hypothetical protein
MKTKLSSQSPSPIPVTFQMDSPSFLVELEVKSKTRTNRVSTKLSFCWCTVCSAQIGEFQDLPLRLVVTPSPPCPILSFPSFLGFSIVALRSNLSILGLPSGESQLSHIRPPFSLKDLLRFLSKFYSLYRLDEVFDILSRKSIN